MNEKQFSAVATRVNEVVQTSKVSQILLSLITNKNSSPFFFSPRLSEIKIEKPPPLKKPLKCALYYHDKDFPLEYRREWRRTSGSGGRKERRNGGIWEEDGRDKIIAFTAL